MEVDTLSRIVQLSVGELANFRSHPRSGGSFGGRWRAGVGQQWHRESARQTLAAHPNAKFEQFIGGTLLHRGWTLELQGRMDEVILDGDFVTLREVKTVCAPLPCRTEDLVQDYPEYFAQAAIYKRLAALLPEYSSYLVQAELLFIEINNGTVQRVRLDANADQTVEAQLDELVRFLDDRRERRAALRQLDIRPAFSELREGQAELIGQLTEAASKRAIVLLQAPTGFGKTGIALGHALRRMQDGLFERCIYLTSKSSGQLETVRQLRGMLGGGLRYLQMRNRAEHEIASPGQDRTNDWFSEASLEQQWLEAGINPPDLLRSGTFTLEAAKALSLETGIDPYDLTKACLPFAELWIGDSNYIFGPQSRQVFTEAWGYDPARTILIIDEAHNLPTRNADALSVEIDGTDLIFTIEELRGAGATRRLIHSLEGIADELSGRVSGHVLTLEESYALSDRFETAAKFLEDSQFDYHAIAPHAHEVIWRIPELATRLDEFSPDWLHWSPADGCFRAQCLDASRWTASCLKPFGSTILMSATLDPVDKFQQEIGISPEERSLAIGWADWREAAYDVAIDCRVDTRLKHRRQHYETTARTIVQMVAAAPDQPVVAFFPSYHYAESVNAYLSAIDESLRTAIQPRGVSLDRQTQFIEEALLMTDAIFLILGSSYAEGIDKLGGRVGSAIIVGPALPEVNAVQKAKMEIASFRSSEAAFEEVYLVPAMRRVHQALGRMVRSPGQRARVLLHCKRFAQEAYHQMLQVEYTTSLRIHNDSSLLDWLSPNGCTVKQPFPAEN